MTSLPDLAARLVALPECDHWTAALLRTFAAGDVDAAGLAAMVRTRADALAVELAAAGVSSSWDLALLCGLEAAHAALVGDMARAARCVGHVEAHLAGLAVEAQGGR